MCSGVRKALAEELRLPSRAQKSGGSRGAYFVDWILAHADAAGKLLGFVAIEVQSIDTTGNYLAERLAYLEKNGSFSGKSTAGLNWENVNKRILPQITYKGHVLRREPLCQKYLVDGFVAMEAPALPLRRMGATHVISVSIPNEKESVDPGNMLPVLNRCFQVMTDRLQGEWRRHSNLVIEPDVAAVAWDSFHSAEELMQMGERAAIAAIPTIERWLSRPAPAAPPKLARPGSALTPILE